MTWCLQGQVPHPARTVNLYSGAAGDGLRRRRYDMHGKAVVQEAAGAIDPAAMFAMLFGTDAFEDYVGQLTMATMATLDQASRPDMLAQLQALQAVRAPRCSAPGSPGVHCRAAAGPREPRPNAPSETCAEVEMQSVWLQLRGEWLQLQQIAR